MKQAEGDAYIVARLEEAGATLLALPGGGCYPAGFRSSMPEPVRDVIEGYGWDDLVDDMRPAAPSAAAIARMDEALDWLLLVDQPERRRIVYARSLFHPIKDRHLYSYRRLGFMLGCSDFTVRARHREAICQIWQKVSRTSRPIRYVDPDARPTPAPAGVGGRF